MLRRFTEPEPHPLRGQAFMALPRSGDGEFLTLNRQRRTDMIGAPMTAHQELEQMDVIVRAVDRRGREMDQRWGIGRLTTIVPPELGEKFRVQRRKFSAATLDLNL